MLGNNTILIWDTVKVMSITMRNFGHFLLDMDRSNSQKQQK